MATASKQETVTVTLTLSAHEAGALIDVLSAHVGGFATCDKEVLGRIRVALESTEIERVYLTDKRHAFPADENIRNMNYPVLEELDRSNSGW